jgi:hypothetical protein
MKINDSEVYGVESPPSDNACCLWGAAAIIRNGRIFNSLIGDFLSCEEGEYNNCIALLPNRIKVDNWKDLYVFLKTESFDSNLLFEKVYDKLVLNDKLSKNVFTEVFIVPKDDIDYVTDVFAIEINLIASEFLSKGNQNEAVKWWNNCFMFDPNNLETLQMLSKYGDDTDKFIANILLKEK